jgi:hypothetical protein
MLRGVAAGGVVLLLGCSGIVDSVQQRVQGEVDAQVNKVEAKVADQVRTGLDQACVRQFGEVPRVHEVCRCVADQLLASQSPTEILARLDEPLELARPYVETCGNLLLEGTPAAPPEAAPAAEPAPAPAGGG